VFKAKQAPTGLAEHHLAAGIMLSDALLETKLVTSKREARREIEAGSVRVDDVKSTADVALSGPEHVVQVGKRRWAKIFVPSRPTV